MNDPSSALLRQSGSYRNHSSLSRSDPPKFQVLVRFWYGIFSLLIACSALSAGEFHILSTEGFTRLGMFAAANQVLGYLDLYENGGGRFFAGFCVDFGVNGLYYDPERGPNWWDYYFEPISVGKRKGSRVKSVSKEEGFRALIHRRQITRARAGALVKKYVHVKRPILEKVDQFALRHFHGFFTIGVHYRGTDKELEAPRVAYEVVIESILNQIPSDQPYQIFVATDEVPFLETMQQRFPNRVVAIEAHRSVGEQGIHLSNDHPHEIGVEALMDALLLSKCDLLIRTSSNLSLWSTYFNPELPVILLNQRICQTLEPE